MMKRFGPAIVVVALCVVIAIGGTAAFSPSLDIVHQHDEHEGEVVDVEYGDHHDVVWSIDEGGTFAAYDVGAEDVGFTWEFEQGHAIAVSEEAVFVAEGDTLWEFDVDEGEFNDLGTLAAHPEDMAYDEVRDVVWIAGDETVYGYDATDGSEFMSYSEHNEGTGVIDVEADYVVSGSAWETEVIVYDVEEEEVVYEPDLPDDTQGISALNLLDSETLLVGALGDDADDLVAGYDVEEDVEHFTHREHIFGVSFVGYEPQNDLIISAGADNTVKFYDAENDQVVEEYQHEDTIYTASPDYLNSLLWLGDGEERDGLVSGLDIFYEEDSDDDSTDDGTGDGTDDDSTDDGAADDGDDTDDGAAEDSGDDAGDSDDDDTDDSADGQSDTDSTEDGDDDSDDGGSPGFGALAAVMGIIGTLYFRHRRHA